MAEVNQEFADWLLTWFATELIDAVKKPDTEGDEIIRTWAMLDPLWQSEVNKRIRELPR